jgi:hypothetical protein
MRGTIDSCLAKKLPPIAARNFAAFAQDTCVTCHMHSLVNLLLGIGHHPSLKSQSVSFVFHFLNWIMLYYDAFFTRGILGHRPLTFFVTSHTTGSVHQPQDGKCTPATIWHVYISHNSPSGVGATCQNMAGRPLSLSVPLSTPLKPPVRFLEPHSILE